MPMPGLRVLLCGTLALVVPTQAIAQLSPAQNSSTGALGAVNFDVDGVATTIGVSGRGAVALTPRVAIEGNLSWAENDQTGGSTMWESEGRTTSR